MSFEIVEFSILKIFKVPVHRLAGLADHYFLGETSSIHNSIGWGAGGLELQGRIKVTLQELERVERFMAVAQYSIAIHNCEHFANYVLHGINLSSQQHLWWKGLSSEVISLLQPVQSLGNNYNSFLIQEIAKTLNENLRQARIARINQERIEFWKLRGIEVK